MEENVEQIIQELLNIEDECGAVERQLIADKATLESRIAAKKAEIDAAMDERLEQELSVIRSAELEAARQKLTDVSVQSQKQFADMEAIYEQNGGRWAAEIFERVIA